MMANSHKQVNQGPVSHRVLRLIARFINTGFAIELRLISIVRLIIALCETGPVCPVFFMSMFLYIFFFQEGILKELTTLC